MAPASQQHPKLRRPSTGNQTRYRVVTSSDDTGGESFTMELLIREGAYGASRGTRC
jgi:hypothetical protein